MTSNGARKCSRVRKEYYDNDHFDVKSGFKNILFCKIGYFSNKLGPNESIEHNVSFNATRTGTRTLIVAIDSNEQPDFQNSAIFKCN